MALVIGVNSFITVADADLYFGDNLQNDSWAALSVGKKSQALITAAGQINFLLAPGCQFIIAEDDINDDLANANAEYALQLVLNPALLTASNTNNNTKRVKAGSVEVEFFKFTRGPRFPPNVQNLLNASGCLANKVSTLNAGGASYGTGDASIFEITDFNKMEGYP